MFSGHFVKSGLSAPPLPIWFAPPKFCGYLRFIIIMFAAHKTATDMEKIKRMDQIRRILETYIATNSLKATSRRLEVSRNTVKVYLDRGENILITGATGCGKSYLACALGNNACVHGYRTLYFNLNRFTEQIALAKTDGTLIKWLDRMKKAKLISLDDFGLQPISHAVKLILLQILEDRYEQASTLICSQLPVGKWHEYFDEPTLADAILDRIIPKAHRLELKGNSLRKKSKHLS